MNAMGHMFVYLFNILCVIIENKYYSLPIIVYEYRLSFCLCIFTTFLYWKRYWPFRTVRIIKNKVQIPPDRKQRKLDRRESESHCCICLDDSPTHILIPCGHQCVCEECSRGLRKCPMCRKGIT
eukprot:UN18503